MRRSHIERMSHPSSERGRSFAPDRQSVRENEVFLVLREIGIHLAAFLGIALVINLLVVLLGGSPTPL